MLPNALALVGLGMTTSIGHDAGTSCASFRAGITRAAPLHYHEEHSEEEDEPVPVTGHAAAVPTLNAEGLGKIVVLGAAALKNLLATRGKSIDPGERIGVYLVVPNYSLREDRFIDFNKPEALAAALAPARPTAPKGRARRDFAEVPIRKERLLQGMPFMRPKTLRRPSQLRSSNSAARSPSLLPSML